MTTLAQIGTNALVELGAVIGGNTPSTEDAARANEAVLAVYNRLAEYSGDRGLADIEISEDTQACVEQRIICTVTGLTVKTPLKPADMMRFAVIPVTGSATVTPMSRKLEGASDDITVSAPKTWMYRADLADWVVISGLTTTDAVPFAEWFEDSLMLLVAENLAPKIPVEISREVGLKIMNAHKTLREKRIINRDLRVNEIPSNIAGYTTSKVQVWT